MLTVEQDLSIRISRQFNDVEQLAICHRRCEVGRMLEEGSGPCCGIDTAVAFGAAICSLITAFSGCYEAAAVSIDLDWNVDCLTIQRSF